MAKNTHQAKEAGKESGESLPRVEESRVEKEEKEEEERYIVQVSKAVDGEESYVPVRKENKIFVFSSRNNAEESMRRIMQRHPEVLRARVMRVVKRGESSVLVPEIEISGREIIKHSQAILPEELRGYVNEEMLEFMSEEELSGVRSLIAELIRKKTEIERFSRIAVQRSAFKKDTKRVKKMEELQKEYQKRKERLAKARVAYEEIKEEVRNFIEENLKEFPELLIAKN